VTATCSSQGMRRVQRCRGGEAAISHVVCFSLPNKAESGFLRFCSACDPCADSDCDSSPVPGSCDNCGPAVLSCDATCDVACEAVTCERVQMALGGDFPSSCTMSGTWSSLDNTLCELCRSSAQWDGAHMATMSQLCGHVFQKVSEYNLVRRVQPVGRHCPFQQPIGTTNPICRLVKDVDNEAWDLAKVDLHDPSMAPPLTHHRPCTPCQAQRTLNASSLLPCRNPRCEPPPRACAAIPLWQRQRAHYGCW